MENKKFDYFYETNHENFLFLQMPIALIKDERFKGLSESAKILYSLFLNRTSLSRKNNWTDKEGRIYIIYTVAEIMEDLNCWKEKAHKAMKELKTMNLITTIQQGLTKPNLIYVMNFSTELKYKIKEEFETPKTVENKEEFENRTPESSKIEPPDELKIEPQPVRKSNPNQINVTQNHLNQTDVSISIGESEPNLSKTPPIDMIDNKKIKVFTKAEVENKIGLADLKAKHPDKLEDLDIIFDVLCDILTNNNILTPATVRISRQNLPYATVNAEFQKIDQTHIDYVFHSLNNNGNRNKINKNVKNYVMTALFHAPRTISYYFNRSFSAASPAKPGATEKKHDGLTIEEMLERRIKRTLKI